MNSILPQTISISDLQKRTKEIFDTKLQDNAPTLILNRNEKVGVLIKPMFFEELMSTYEDYLAGLELMNAINTTPKKDLEPWDKIKLELKKHGKLS